MAKKITLDRIRTAQIWQLPKHVTHLATRALFVVDWGTGRSAAENHKKADFDTIEAMVNECVANVRTGRVDEVWMLVLLQVLIDSQDDLNRRWPWPAINLDGRLHTRTIFGRMFGSVALWRIDLAMGALAQGKHESALNEIALAGIALHFAGSTEADNIAERQHAAPRKEGARVRWLKDPTQLQKQHMRAEWDRWQSDRGLYRYPKDFRLAMLNRFPEAVDGTLKNWMSDWAKGTK